MPAKLINNDAKAYLVVVDDAGGSLDPSRLPNIPPVFGGKYTNKNEAQLWNWLAINGWLDAEPFPTDRFKSGFPNRVTLTPKGKAALREIRKEQEVAQKRGQAHDSLHSLVKMLQRKYPEAQLSLGYLGNFERWGDDRAWYVFTKLSKPGSYGHESYKWGGYAAERDGIITLWNWAKSNLEKAVQKAVEENDGPYKGPRPYPKWASHKTARTTGEEMYDALKKIVDERQAARIDGILIDLFSASGMVQVADALNPVNRERFLALPLEKMHRVTFKMIKGASARVAARWTEQEALAAFDRWWKRDGHWIYPTREKALETWKTRGIQNLPDWPGRRASTVEAADPWSKLPKGWTKGSVRKFWDSLTSRAPKHKVTECIDKMKGSGMDDPGAFCASLADKMIPGWRQEAAKERAKEAGWPSSLHDTLKSLHGELRDAVRRMELEDTEANVFSNVDGELREGIRELERYGFRSASASQVAARFLD